MNRGRAIRIGLGSAALIAVPALLQLRQPSAAPTPPSTSVPVTTTPATSSVPEVTSSTSTTSAAAATTTPPEFRSSISPIAASDVPASWREGCPVGIEGLRSVTLSHWGLDGNVHSGTLVVAAEVADDIVGILESLFTAGFPIERMERVDSYDGDDDRSMAANNTSAFNCRAATGGSRWSEHSYGIAVDINPLLNPYVTSGTVLPPEGSEYADRGLDHPGMIHQGDEVVGAFSAKGWIWGGTWTSTQGLPARLDDGTLTGLPLYPATAGTRSMAAATRSAGYS